MLKKKIKYELFINRRKFRTLSLFEKNPNITLKEFIEFFEGILVFPPDKSVYYFYKDLIKEKIEKEKILLELVEDKKENIQEQKQDTKNKRQYKRKTSRKKKNDT